MDRNRWLLFPLLLVLAVGLGYTVLSLPDHAEGLRKIVTDQMEVSGVSNPVTAVLLNFRGYDTLLEMVVLLLALLGVWTVGGKALRRQAAPGPVLDTLARLLVPVLLLVAAYLLWSVPMRLAVLFRRARCWVRPGCCCFWPIGASKLVSRDCLCDSLWWQAPAPSWQWQCLPC